MRWPRWICWHGSVTLRVGQPYWEPPFVCRRCGMISWESDNGPWEVLGHDNAEAIRRRDKAWPPLEEGT